MPDRLAFPRGRSGGATLHVRVAGAAALELQHLAPQIVERINVFFGYAAVDRIALVQGPITVPPARPEAEAPASVPADRAAAIDREAAVIDDPELRAAIAGLGRAIAVARVPRRR
jgi:hypothetical protein